MTKKDINTIISKYLDEEATVSEETFLLNWIKDPDNRNYFEDFIKTQTWVAYSFDTSIVERQLHALSIDAPVERQGFGKKLLKYAALLIALFSTAVFLYYQINLSAPNTFDKNLLSLEINDGESHFYSLENLSDFSIQNRTISLKEGRILRYAPSRITSDAIHTVHVPYGKMFKVILSDGSVVRLNSGSRFSYPANFHGLGARSVSLEGEGYFEIAKSDTPFRVKTDKLTTEVLGTVFNVSAYENDTKEEVILVEGSVQVFEDTDVEKCTTMMPNQKVSLRSGNKAFEVETIRITSQLGWIDGFLVFHEDNITSIAKKIERRFGINVQNNYEKLEHLSFNGRFSEKETLRELLQTMQAHTAFSYTITEDTLTINEPDN